MAARIKEKAKKNLRNESMACSGNSVLYAISTLRYTVGKNCLYQNCICVALAVNSVVKKQ